MQKLGNSAHGRVTASSANHHRRNVDRLQGLFGWFDDGNGSFTEGMGMLIDKSDLGFGKRSWRYSMLVNDGVIRKMFIEPDKPGDPFEVSDADTMLHYINASAKPPDQVAIFTREGCEYCAKAKALLTEHGVDYAEVALSNAVRGKVLGAVIRSGHGAAGLRRMGDMSADPKRSRAGYRGAANPVRGDRFGAHLPLCQRQFRYGADSHLGPLRARANHRVIARALLRPCQAS